MLKGEINNYWIMLYYFITNFIYPVTPSTSLFRIHTFQNVKLYSSTKWKPTLSKLSNTYITQQHLQSSDVPPSVSSLTLTLSLFFSLDVISRLIQAKHSETSSNKHASIECFIITKYSIKEIYIKKVKKKEKEERKRK